MMLILGNDDELRVMGCAALHPSYVCLRLPAIPDNGRLTASGWREGSPGGELTRCLP